jgi:hypothetical protein
MAKTGPKANTKGTVGELTGSNIDKVENETIEKVSRTITVLEGALATWEASEEKPAELEEKFTRYRKFRDALAVWETSALKARGKEESFDTRVRRLKDFINICYSYA